MEKFVHTECHSQLLLGAGQDSISILAFFYKQEEIICRVRKSAEAGIISFETCRQQWQIHAPEVVIIELHSDVCYIFDKHHGALLRRGGGHLPFAEDRYSCCGSCWSREATTSPANGHLCWPLALLEQGDKQLSSFWFANSMGEWRKTCFLFGHNPLAISISLWQNPLFFLYIPTLLFCSFALFVCLIMLEMVSNFAQIFST